jgi:hypothetical protein
VYNSLDFQERPIFQVCLQVQLLQLYFFCTYATITTMNTRALCCIYQQRLKFQQVWHLE